MNSSIKQLQVMNEPQPTYDCPSTDEIIEKKKSKTIKDIITRWWDDVFSSHSDWSKETCIDDLVDQIELWNLRNKEKLK